VRAPRVIGLTGGIGSGKSTVSAMLAELGARVVDADKIGHWVYRPGSDGFRAVVDAFGAGVVAADGTIDRARLGAIVFADADARARLNAIVEAERKKLSADSSQVAVEAARKILGREVST